jgi:hypothetical protein
MPLGYQPPYQTPTQVRLPAPTVTTPRAPAATSASSSSGQSSPRLIGGLYPSSDVFPGHPPNTAYVSDDYLVGYDAQGYRLDALGHRAFHEGGGGGYSAPDETAVAASAATTTPTIAANQGYTVVPNATPTLAAATGKMTTTSPLGAVLASPTMVPSANTGFSTQKYTTPTTATAAGVAPAAVASTPDATTGLMPWYTGLFTGMYGSPESYYTGARGGIGQASDDYNALRSLWYNRTGRLFTPEDMTQMLGIAAGWMKTLGRPATMKDLYDYIELRTRAPVDWKQPTYFNLGQF